MTGDAYSLIFEVSSFRVNELSQQLPKRLFLLDLSESDRGPILRA